MKFIEQHPLPWSVFNESTVFGEKPPTSILDSNGSTVIMAYDEYDYSSLEGAQELVDFINTLNLIGEH